MNPVLTVQAEQLGRVLAELLAASYRRRIENETTRQDFMSAELDKAPEPVVA